MLYTATRSIPDIQRQIEQTENFINILLGQNPGPVKRGRPLEQQIAAPALPLGLPSDLLTRRPDVRQAEQLLVAANAQIGVAKALLYPQITLSVFAGGGSVTVEGTSYGPFGVFSVLPQVTLPVFNMGRLRRNVDYNEALAQEAGLRYQQVLQQAFREVADALVEIRKRREYRQQQELLVSALSRCQRGGQAALRGRRVELPGSAGHRAPVLRRRSRAGPGESATSRWPSFFSTKPWVADGRPRRRKLRQAAGRWRA